MPVFEKVTVWRAVWPALSVPKSATAGETESVHAGTVGTGVNSMLSVTACWPAAPASTSSVEVRLPATAWPATETVANALLPPSSVPLAGAKVTVLSPELPTHERATPPELAIESDCAEGAEGTCAVKLSTSGVTANCAGAGGGGGAEVKVMSSSTVALPALPASKVAWTCRLPAPGCPATETSTVAAAPGASVPPDAPSETPASSSVPAQVSDCPPVLRSCTCCGAGALGACAR